MPVRVRVLGPVRVDGAGDRAGARLGGPKERTVLAVLALRAGQHVDEELLVAALWGDDPPRTAVKTLQSYVARVRRVVGDAIQPEPGGYRLRAGVDAADAERLAGTARAAAERGDHRRAAEAFDEALVLWEGRPLVELADTPWLAAEAHRLAELRLALSEERADAWLACGRAGELVPALEATVAEAPLRERSWAQLITALYRAGRQADALRAYQRLRSVLAEELGIDPSPELQALEAAVLGQALGPAPPPTAVSDVLEVVDDTGRRTVALSGGPLCVGRAAENDVVLAGDAEVSRRHAVIERLAGGWIVTDLGSRNGTTVNGVRTSGRRSLRPGDEVRIGRARLVLRSPGEAGAEPAGDETVGAAGP